MNRAFTSEANSGFAWKTICTSSKAEPNCSLRKASRWKNRLKRDATLARLTAVFFRIGNTTFGGGDPTMAALRRELVERKEWLTDEDYATAFALARVTPGTNVVAFCAAAGAKI